MPQSATSTRERRKADTARGLAEAARGLTIEHGLNGFTIEELCERVGVSRRTFFNYFASKENAVIGVPVDRDESGASERFLAAGARGMASLVDDLVDLHLDRWTFGGVWTVAVRDTRQDVGGLRDGSNQVRRSAAAKE